MEQFSIHGDNLPISDTGVIHFLGQLVVDELPQGFFNGEQILVGVEISVFGKALIEIQCGLQCVFIMDLNRDTQAIQSSRFGRTSIDGHGRCALVRDAS